MDQLSPLSNIELPQPTTERINESTDSEVGLIPGSKLDKIPQSERLTSANDAVSQAVYGQPIINSTAIKGNNPVVISTQPAAANPIIADDNDVIEKEWVQKAKNIVGETKTEPHQQSVQLSYLKKDYIKKRFDKDIKLPDDQTG